MPMTAAAAAAAHAEGDDRSEVDDRADGLTPAKVAILVAAGAVLWLIAAAFIRFAGPGAFTGVRLPVTYGLTVPLTMLAIRRSRLLAGLSARRTLEAVNVTSVTGCLLDAVAFNGFPDLYGPDPAARAAGAVWLLFAIGAAQALAQIRPARSAAF